MSGGLGHKRPSREATPERGAATAPPLASRPEDRLVARAVNPGLRATIAVTGSASNAGKTWLGERMIEALLQEGLPTGALKVTRTHVARCPRENDACGVCDGLEKPFDLVRDGAVLAMPKKDTGRYVRAGASPVRWLIVQPASVRDGVLAALAEFGPGTVLVAEGNSFRDFVDPDLTLMMLSDRAALKESARYLLDRVDAFVCREGAQAHFREFLGDLLGGRPLLAPDDAAPFVVARLRTAGLA